MADIGLWRLLTYTVQETMLVFFVTVVLFVLILIKKQLSRNLSRTVIFSAFFCYLTVLIYLAVLSRGVNTGIQRFDFSIFRITGYSFLYVYYSIVGSIFRVPFIGVEDYNYGLAFNNIFEGIKNIILFVPLGYLIPLLNGKAVKSLKKIALCGFVLSLFVEVIQLVSYRGTFDLDDLLHNTTGTVIGCILYIVLLNKFQKIYDFIKASAKSVFHTYKA